MLAMKFVRSCRASCAWFAALCSFVCVGWSQEAPKLGVNTSQPEELVINQIKKTVVFFTTSYIENNQRKSWGGTGFLILAPVSGTEKGGLVWLVTNKHLLHPPDRPFFDQVTIRVNTTESSPLAGQAQDLRMPVVDQAGNLRWVVDDDPSVDLTIVPVSPDKTQDVMWTSTDTFLTRESFKKLRVTENDDILFAGLFASYYGRKRNYPLVRHGKLALVTDERIPIDSRDATKTEDLILAEVTSIPGNSGSPVFLRIGGIREGDAPKSGFQYYLLGIMQGCFTTSTDVSFDLTATARGELPENSGIAAVIPAENLLHLLSLPQAKSLTFVAQANSLRNQGKYNDAETFYKQAISQIEAPGPSKDPQLAGVLDEYAEMLTLSGRKTDAENIKKRAASIRSAIAVLPSVPSTRSCDDAECLKLLTSSAGSPP